MKEFELVCIAYDKAIDKIINDKELRGMLKGSFTKTELDQLVEQLERGDY